jgi:hypothetical protein
LLLVEKETYNTCTEGVETPGGCVGCLGGQTVIGRGKVLMKIKGGTVVQKILRHTLVYWVMDSKWLQRELVVHYILSSTAEFLFLKRQH